MKQKKRKKERQNNIEIINKLDSILKLSEFNENKTRILILTLKNKDHNKIKVVINLRNFYFQGFINNINQYFYFKDAELKSIKISNKQIDGIPLSYNWVYLKDLDVKEGQLDRKEKEKKDKIASELINNDKKIKKNDKYIQDNKELNKKIKELKNQLESLEENEWKNIKWKDIYISKSTLNNTIEKLISYNIDQK